MDSGQVRRVEAVVRSLSTAGKSLRLYPESSPIPRQSVESALDAIGDYFFQGESVLALTLTRDGFGWMGEPLSASAPGASDLAQELRDHGVAELVILPGPTAHDLLTFLSVLGRSAEELRVEGGISAALASAGVDVVRLVDVQLTVIEQVAPGEDEDIDDFLRALIADPVRLAAWFAGAANGDPGAFEEGLMELVRVAGPSGYDGLLQALSNAFLSQEPGGKDALLRLAIDKGPVHDLTGGIFRFLPSTDIAGSILGGGLGKNMLSLSNALTSLPLEQVTAEVRAEIQAMLPGSGHTSKEAEFLQHMIEVRERAEPEPALQDADGTYRALAKAAHLPDEIVERARKAVLGSNRTLSAASVRTVLKLLDQQTNFELYASSAQSLAAMVPRLLEQRDLELAQFVLAELRKRETMNTGPSPEISGRIRAAMDAACGSRAMKALVQSVIDDPEDAAHAREIVRLGGESAALAFAEAAIAHKSDGIRACEPVLGRRTLDLLSRAALQAQWFQLAPVVARLAAEDDVRASQALETLVGRPDEQSRREVANGLAVGGPSATRLLPKLLRDPSAEVAIVAVRVLSRTPQAGAGTILATRLAELDVDGGDFAIAREIIGALARVPDASADEALGKLAGRRALIKRGHFAEVQDLVRRAQLARAKGVR